MPEPEIGATKTVFGRKYVYMNPDQAIGPGCWRLADSPSGATANDEAASSSVYGQATVADDSPLIEQGMLVRLSTTGKAYPALATTAENARVVGVAMDRTVSGQVVRFTTNTSFEIFNADKITDEGSLFLEIGLPYYLSSESAGKWTLNPSSNSHDYLTLQCGIAVDMYHMSVDIQTPST